MPETRVTPTVPPVTYRGRFAPSPTGPLHVGSLVAALASSLEARAHGGEWLVRMEDVDRPRCAPGAADSILRTLESFGFEWDGPVMVQSGRGEAYAAALTRLREGGWLYPCACSRKQLQDGLRGVDGAAVYPGTCRGGLPAGATARAWRVRIGVEPVCFDDAVQGRCCQQLACEVGDFVLRRADGLVAYQLAVVVDDADQGITHVVRGADLLDSTPRQIHLQHLLGLPTPRYAHLPVVLNATGEKLSKQTLAPPADARRAAWILASSLAFLGQSPPPGLHRAALAEVWAWARAHWSLDRVPKRRGVCGAASPDGFDQDQLTVPQNR